MKSIDSISDYLASSSTGNFFLLAGPCVIEGEQMALDIAGNVSEICKRLNIPYVFKGSYRKANRSRIDSFTGIGDMEALEILKKVRNTFSIPVFPIKIPQHLERKRIAFCQSCHFLCRTHIQIKYVHIALPHGCIVQRL